MTILSYSDAANTDIESAFFNVRCMESACFYANIFSDELSQANESFLSDIKEKGRQFKDLVIKGFNNLIALIKKFFDNIKASFADRKKVKSAVSATPAVTMENKIEIYTRVYDEIRNDFPKIFGELYSFSSDLRKTLIPYLHEDEDVMQKNYALLGYDSCIDGISDEIDDMDDDIKRILEDDKKTTSVVAGDELNKLSTAAVAAIEKLKNGYERTVSTVDWSSVDEEQYTKFTSISNKLLRITTKVINFVLENCRKAIVTTAPFDDEYK